MLISFTECQAYPISRSSDDRTSIFVTMTFRRISSLSNAELAVIRITLGIETGVSVVSDQY